MKQVARLGDKHVCPVHGPNTITTASSGSVTNGRPIATVGDMTACGATIVTGASNYTFHGKPAATVTSKTSHGGTIVTGCDSLKV